MEAPAEGLALYGGARRGDLFYTPETSSLQERRSTFGYVKILMAHSSSALEHIAEVHILKLSLVLHACFITGFFVWGPKLPIATLVGPEQIE